MPMLYTVRRIPVNRVTNKGCSEPSITNLKHLSLQFYFEQPGGQAATTSSDLNEYRISFAYVDEESDDIVFSTDIEFIEALQCCSIVSGAVSSSATAFGNCMRLLRVKAVVEPVYCQR